MQDANDKNEGKTELNEWQPKKILQACSPLEVRYSRGFLRCSPEKWFPSFSMQWLPLVHSLGVELAFLDAKPFIAAKNVEQCFGFVASIDDEPLCIYIDKNSADIVTSYMIPDASGIANEVLLEYLVMRLVTSLAISWSGSESSLIRFESDMLPSSVRTIGTIDLKVSLNGVPICFSIMLGKLLIEKMDLLWRKQLSSSTVQGSQKIHLEIGHLTVPPSLLADYVKAGIFYDIEIPLSDNINLYIDDKLWANGKLKNVNGNFAVETVALNSSTAKIPVGTTKLAFELGTIELDSKTITELSQVGAIFDYNIKISDEISIVVNGEKVAKGFLRTYRGSFVVSVY